MKIFSGISALALCAIGWSTGGIFIKFVNANSFAIAGIRSFIAMTCLIIFTRRLPHFVIYTANKNAPRRVNKKATAYLWLAAICYSATMILYCTANKLTTAANVTLLQYTAPVYVVILGPVLLKEKNAAFDYACVAGVLAGMILFFADGLFAQSNPQFAQTKNLGNVLATASGITYALCTIFLRKQSGSSKDSFILAQLLTAIAGLPFVIANGVPDTPSIIFLVLLGCVQMALPNLLYAIGVASVRALTAILVTMIEPLMNPVWVAIFAHEVPSAACITGGVIILLCILARELLARRIRRPQN